MKKIGAVSALLTPCAEGWLLTGASGPASTFATLAAAAAALPSGRAVHLALPCETLLIEGLRLPTTEPAELAGMVRLQLEKNLPYPLDEVSADFVVVETTEKDSAVISLAASHPALENLCLPLRDRGSLPERITPYVLHVAAVCPPNETVLVVYPEQGRLVLIICQQGRLAWAYLFARTDAAQLPAELRQALLAAAVEGVPTEFSRVLLASEAHALSPALREILSAPMEALPAVSPDLDAPFNLVPPSWRNAAQQRVRQQRTYRWLHLAATLYLIALLAGAGYWYLLQREAATLAAQVEAVQPGLQFIQTQQARFNTLAPAIDPNRTTVELLFLVQRALPDDSTRITEFDQQPDQWRVVGEAPNAALAIDYITRLKADPDLSAYQISANPPQLLPNEHAQFNIFGKQ